MRKTKIGELEVSAVGFGCMGLSHAYGAALPKKQAIAQIHAAYDAGYTFFDTAEIYKGEYADGTSVLNDEIVGEAIQPFKNDIVLATKCGLKWENGQMVSDASPESIRASIDSSLKRLNLDHIDLLYLHRQDPNVEPEVVADTMAELIKAGKIRYWGISNATSEFIEKADDVCKVTAVQLRFSMMARENKSYLPMLEKRNIGFVAYSPLANGFLTNGKKQIAGSYDKLDFRNLMPQYTEDGMTKAQSAIDLITKIAEEKNATAAQISLAWMMCKKPWIVPIPGTTKKERMLENAGASDILLNASEISRIDSALDGMDFDVFGVQK